MNEDQMIKKIELRGKLSMVQINNVEDVPRWKANKSGICSVKSLYAQISNVGPDRSFKYLWEAKIPLKIKIWQWLIWHNAIASKDNMIRRNWQGGSFLQFLL